MSWDLVIFDCDGVLVDSERISVRIDVRVLAELGWPLTEAEVIERFVGRSEEYMIGEVEAALGRRLPPDWEAPFRHLYRDAFEAELEPVDGVVAALDAIAAPTCVASSSSHERLRHTLGLTGLLDRFDGRIFSAEDFANGKPAPDLFLHAATTLGADPARCAVIEDSRHGVEAARAAGMRAFAYGGRPRSTASRSGSWRSPLCPRAGRAGVGSGSAGRSELMLDGHDARAARVHAPAAGAATPSRTRSRSLGPTRSR